MRIVCTARQRASTHRARPLTRLLLVDRDEQAFPGRAIVNQRGVAIGENLLDLRDVEVIRNLHFKIAVISSDCPDRFGRSIDIVGNQGHSNHGLPFLVRHIAADSLGVDTDNAHQSDGDNCKYSFHDSFVLRVFRSVCLIWA